MHGLVTVPPSQDHCSPGEVGHPPGVWHVVAAQRPSWPLKREKTQARLLGATSEGQMGRGLQSGVQTEQKDRLFTPYFVVTEVTPSPGTQVSQSAIKFLVLFTVWGQPECGQRWKELPAL